MNYNEYTEPLQNNFSNSCNENIHLESFKLCSSDYLMITERLVRI